MTPISSTKQTPFTCLGIRKIFVWHEICQIFQFTSHNLRKTLPKKVLSHSLSASLLSRRLPEYLVFIRQSKGEDGRLILYL